MDDDNNPEIEYVDVPAFTPVLPTELPIGTATIVSNFFTDVLNIPVDTDAINAAGALLATLVTMELTANQEATVISYLMSIDESRFESSDCLRALNAEDPMLALHAMGDDVRDENGRWTHALVNRRLHERALFLS